MVYITSFEGQNWLLPPNIEELIPSDHVCYLVDELIGSVNFSRFDENYAGAGHPAYHPRILLKLLVMGVLDRVRSSRRLARNARENVVYMYLAEKLSPDFRTISDFRKNNPNLIKDVFRHTVLLAKQHGLLDLTVLSTDGTKLKANASGEKTLTKDELKYLMRFVDTELTEWASQDVREDTVFGTLRGSDQLGDSSKKKMERIVRQYVKEVKEYGDIFVQKISAQLHAAHKDVAQDDSCKVSLTDPQSRFMRNNGKIELSYNAQITVDKNGFILTNNVCQNSEDTNQLKQQVRQTTKEISLPKNTVWNFDNGYHSGENLAFLAQQGINALIPNQEQAQRHKGKEPIIPFANRLSYDPERDEYVAPDGSVFTFVSETFYPKYGRNRREYAFYKNGRRIHRIRVSEYDRYQRLMASIMESPQGIETYKIRKQTVEPAFGDVKENKGFRNFLTRGLPTVQTEFTLVCIAHNLQKMWKGSMAA